MSGSPNTPEIPGSLEPAQSAPEVSTPASERARPREIGGPQGPEPTRYGDWERSGRCIDF
jgi:hypothetical protein